jgi:putative DNA primase/helicase
LDYHGFKEEEIKKLFEWNQKLNDLYNGDWEKYSQELKLQPEKATIIRFIAYGLDKNQIFKMMDDNAVGKWKEKDDNYKELTYRKAFEFVSERERPDRNQKIKYNKEKYKLGEKFKPSLLADDIMKDFVFKTSEEDQTIFWYNDGIYHNDGEVKVYQEVKRRYGEDITTHLAKEVAFHIRTETFIKRNQFNKFPHLIHLENGIFNLDKMQLEPFTPDIISTVRLPIEYDPKEDCQKIKEFFTEILHLDDIPIIQELIGYYILKDYRFQKAFMFIGDGANGKSTLMELIKNFLGKGNISSVELQSLETDRFAAAQLNGKLANICADISDKAMHRTGKFKMLTGGDLISAQQKFKKPFNFVNFAKLTYSANKLPEAHDDTKAFFRRWIIIDFPNIFEGENADKNMLKRIITEKELSGLFNWAIEGLKRLLKNGDFSYTLSTEEITIQYKRISSSLQAFVDDRVDVQSQERIPKEDFYLEYVKYCKEYKLPVKAKNVVGSDLPKFIHVETAKISFEDGRKNCWIGIKLKKEDVKDVKDVNLFSNFKLDNIINKRYRKYLDNVDTLDTKKEEKVNKLGRWAINYLKNNRNVPKNFFINDVLKEFSNADKKKLEEFYDRFKQNEAEREM